MRSVSSGDSKGEEVAMEDFTDRLRVLVKSQSKLSVRVRSARKELRDFIPLIVRNDHGNPLYLSPMHLQWIAHVEYCWSRRLRAIVLAHFGSGKSSTLAVPLACHLLGQDQNLRIKVVTNDNDNAMKRVNAVKRIIESPPYSKVFPNVEEGEKWTNHELYLKRTGFAIDPSVQARGVLTTGIGGRADVILFDDVCDQKNSMDSQQRKKVLSLIEETWLSRLEPDGRVLWIATVWHQDDATHHLMRREGWCTLVQKVSDDCTCIEQEVVGDMGGYPEVIPDTSANAGKG